MSTFKGLLEGPEELAQFIAIDYFEETVFNCRIFLLSHFHHDHMKGLYYSKSRTKFESVFNDSDDKLIFCSPVTSFLLKKENPYLKLDPERIKELKLNEKEMVGQPSDTPIFVTSLAAAHCPGAVMFLIQYGDTSLLYTGDFNLSPYVFKNTIDGDLAGNIDEVYIDSTFAMPCRRAIESHLETFPERENCIRAIICKIAELREAGSSRIVLEIPYYLGVEEIYVRLYESFNVRTMLDDQYMSRYYEEIPDEIIDYMKKYDGVDFEKVRNSVVGFSEVKDDDDSWFIHACNNFHTIRREKDSKGEPKCQSTNKFAQDVKIIKFCGLPFLTDPTIRTMKFGEEYGYVPYSEGKMFGKKFWPYCRGHMTKIFFAQHGSPDDLKNIYNFLKNSRITRKFHFNVLRDGVSAEDLSNWFESRNAAESIDDVAAEVGDLKIED